MRRGCAIGIRGVPCLIGENMVEFAHREALLMRTADALTSSRRARERHFSNDAFIVSSGIRRRNLLTAKNLFGAAALAVLLIGLVAAVSQGIDVSAAIPPGLFESGSHSGASALGMIQPNLGDLSRVQGGWSQEWWAVPKSVYELTKTVWVTSPPSVKTALVSGPFFALWWWSLMTGIGRGKSGGDSGSNEEPDI